MTIHFQKLRLLKVTLQKILLSCTDVMCVMMKKYLFVSSGNNIFNALNLKWKETKQNPYSDALFGSLAVEKFVALRALVSVHTLPMEVSICKNGHSYASLEWCFSNWVHGYNQILENFVLMDTWKSLLLFTVEKHWFKIYCISKPTISLLLLGLNFLNCFCASYLQSGAADD